MTWKERAGDDSVDSIPHEPIFTIWEIVRGPQYALLFFFVVLQLAFLFGVSVTASYTFQYAFIEYSSTKAAIYSLAALVSYLGFATTDFVYGRVSVATIHTGVGERLRSRLHIAAFQAPASEFHQVSAAEFAQTLTTEVNQYTDALQALVANVGQAIPLLVGLIYMTMLDWALTSVYVMIGLVPLAIIGLLARIESRLSSFQKTKYRRLCAFVEDSIAGYSDIAGLNEGEQYAKRFNLMSRELTMRQFLRKQNISSGILSVSSFFTRIGPLALSVSWQLLSFSRLNPAEVVGFVALAVAMPSIGTFAVLFQAASLHRTHGAHVRERLAMSRERAGGGLPISTNVSFTNVTIRSRNSVVIAGVSFEIKEGEKVAIVGRTGSGKSLLLSCMHSNVDLAEGYVSVGGVNISKLDWIGFRKRIAYSNDSPLLLETTALSNLLLGVDISSDTAVEIVKSLALGPVTNLIIDDKNIIGEDTLSTGERQVLGICRAILRSPRLMLFDEATSALSRELEQKLIGFARASAATMVCVSHRLTTITQMDRLIYLSNGTVAFDGNIETARSTPYVERFLSGMQPEV